MMTTTMKLKRKNQNDKNVGLKIKGLYARIKNPGAIIKQKLAKRRFTKRNESKKKESKAGFTKDP